METPTKPLSAEKRRAVIVKTVLELAAQGNPTEITTAAIASHMSLTQGALFRHFPSKEAVWLEVMQWVADQLLDRVDRAAKAASSPVGALKAVFMAHIDFVANHPGVPRVLFSELQRAGDTPAKLFVKALFDRYAGRLCRIIEEGKAAGEILPEVETKTAATMLIGTIQGLVMQSLITADIRQIRAEAPGAFAIYKRGIGGLR